jgi:hypothetical protein
MEIRLVRLIKRRERRTVRSYTMPEVQIRAGDAVNTVKEQAARAREIAELAAERVLSGAERARGASSSIASDTSSRAKDVSQKVSDDVVPTLREVAFQAASAALELWQVAREKAVEAATAAQNEVGNASHLMSAAEKRARDASELLASRFEDVGGRAGEASHLVAERVADVGRSAKDATSAVAHRVEGAGENAKDASAHAAEVTVATSKDTGATILWGGAAAAIIFYVILNEERREQVLHIADTLVKQSRELIRDFQGYDEEFA